jgi:cytoskeletal protein CcmA (bactofilin family)
VSTDLDATVDEYMSPVTDHHARSLVNAQTIVQGTIKSSTDLYVEGQVNGVIECDGVLFVADGAVIDATVEAGGIVVEGSLSGTILCHGRLEIRSSGSVTAEVDTERLVIHDGAVYEGRLRMDAADQSPTAAHDEERAETSPALDPPSSSYPYLRTFSPATTDDDDTDQNPGDTDDTKSRE